MPKILYIAGYGRSGSTILSIILGNHPEFFAGGELTYLLEDFPHRSRRCSCGSPYAECEFWGGLFRDNAIDLGLAKTIRSIEASPIAHRFSGQFISRSAYRAYKDFQRRLLRYIETKSGREIIVDSSKSARGVVGRFFALRKLVKGDVYVVHLVRSGVSTLGSVLVKGSNWALEGREVPRQPTAIRVALGWIRANLWAALLGRSCGAGRYLMIRYEDFVADPVATLQEIGRLVGCDMEPLVERIRRDDRFSVGHQVGGNRVRLQKEVQLKRTGNCSHIEDLRLISRRTFLAFAGWLERFYGYKFVAILPLLSKFWLLLGSAC